jgi:uncharacterized membrane protein YhaH (DUF805 family)
MNYYLMVLNKYAEFNGRAGRAEYWYFVLFNFLIIIGLNILSAMFNKIPGLGMMLGATTALYGLAMIIPGLAVAVRRLHDTNRSGWWMLICLIPLLGAIILIVFMILDSQPGSNQYGPNPKVTTGQASTPATPAA